MTMNDTYSSSTRLVVGGRSRKVNLGAVNPPVVHVSTFLFDSLEDPDDLIRDLESGFERMRANRPHR